GLGRARLQPQAPFRDRPDAARSLPRRPLGDAALSRRRGAQTRHHPNRATHPAQERWNHRHRGPPFRGAEPISPPGPPRSPLRGLGSDPGPSLIDERLGAVLCRLFPQDKARNADGLRRSLEAVSTEPVAAPAASGMAPLLARLIERQTATGLPPP